MEPNLFLQSEREREIVRNDEILSLLKILLKIEQNILRIFEMFHLKMQFNLMSKYQQTNY